MKVSIETSVLQNLTNKAVKGSGRNPGITYTMGINIEVVGSDLVLTTTDNRNTLKVIGKDVCSAQTSGFFTCVDSDLFSKLVAKTTSKLITLETHDTALSFKGNGEYTLPVFADKYNNNEIVRIPDLTIDEGSIQGTLDLDVLKSVITYNKLNLGKIKDNNTVTVTLYYYIDKESIITFNGTTATINMDKLIKTGDFEPMLMQSEFVDLISLIDGHEASIVSDGKKVAVIGDGINVVGVLAESTKNVDGVEKLLFPADKLKVYAGGGLASSCVVPKSAILDSLDRLGLFISNDYGFPTPIRVSFMPDKVVLSNIDQNNNSTNTEVIAYKSSENAVDCTKSINAQMLRTQINVSKDDDIEMFYDPSGKGLVINTGVVFQAVPYVQDYDPSELQVSRG